ncbi:MAG: hypothetical protein LBJ72_01655 [Dysgonamonadaceae bacterium]|nr:hypothetical protein [Dysgonamonadaceae bacterium]
MGKETVKSERNLLMEYFSRVYELSKSGEQFPVDLEMVWPLAYSRKDKCVRALKETGIENVDFQPLPRNGERSRNGRFAGENRVDCRISVPRETDVESIDFQRFPQNGESLKRSSFGGDQRSIDYRISLPCLEWLIARKVRAVFEVYRQVFHLVTDRHEQPKILRTQTYNMPDFMKLCSTFIRHEAVDGTYCVAAMFSDAGAVQSEPFFMDFTLCLPPSALPYTSGRTDADEPARFVCAHTYLPESVELCSASISREKSDGTYYVPVTFLQAGRKRGKPFRMDFTLYLSLSRGGASISPNSQRIGGGYVDSGNSRDLSASVCHPVCSFGCVRSFEHDQ